jgi:hypothetical protein
MAVEANHQSLEAECQLSLRKQAVRSPQLTVLHHHHLISSEKATSVDEPLKPPSPTDCRLGQPWSCWSWIPWSLERLESAAARRSSKTRA